MAETGFSPWLKVGIEPEMPDKMHLEGGPKLGPPLAESEEESFSHSQHMSGFLKAPAGSRYAGPSGPVTETRPVLLTAKQPAKQGSIFSCYAANTQGLSRHKRLEIWHCTCLYIKITAHHNRCADCFPSSRTPCSSSNVKTFVEINSRSGAM